MSASQSKRSMLAPMRKLRPIALAVVAIVVPAIVAAAEDGPYPVWWSPALELESLDAIDARLEREIWKGDFDGMRLIKSDGDTLTQVPAVNCRDLERLTEEEYSGAGSHGRSVQQYHLSQCKAIESLKSAVPASRSFVQDFTYDLESVNYLPAMVDLSPSCDFICREVVANERRIPLSHFHDIRLIQILSQTEMKYWSEDWQIRLVSLARGDFTQDGVEDMLVLSSGGASVFIIARDPARPSPPIAVTRRLVSDLPLVVELGDQESMIPGRNLSAFSEFEVLARVSLSGNPIAQPGDWFVSAIVRPADSKEVELVIAEQVQ